MKKLAFASVLLLSYCSMYDNKSRNDLLDLKFIETGITMRSPELEPSAANELTLDLIFHHELESVASIEIININNGELKFEVLYVPGHTRDGVAYYHKASKSLFGGDIIFRGGIGRSDLYGGDGKQLVKGIKEKILTLPEEVTIYPGHGPITTVVLEKKSNMYLR